MYDWLGGFGYRRTPNGRSLRTITPPTGLVVTTAEARLYWRADDSEADASINMCIGAAQNSFSYLGVIFGTGAYALDMDGFTDDPVELPAVPLNTVSAIKAVALDGTASTVDPSLYLVQKEGKLEIGLVRLLYGQRWPNVRGDLGSASIEFTAGYTPETLPDPLRLAILKVGQTHFDVRGTLSPISFSKVDVDDLVDEYRLYV